MRKLVILAIFSMLALCSHAGDSVANDSVTSDTVAVQKRKSFKEKLSDMVKAFSLVDTHYIEPQAYNFTVMLQNTNTYEIYHLRSKQGQEVVFTPRPTYRIGPYVGWRWIFLGYTFELSHIGGESGHDFDLSLYSNQIGLDLFYRTSGDNYRISRFDLGDDFNTRAMKKVPFDGFDASQKGFNIYYIFNHRKFSYPAAYSQSTIQRRSAGSPMAGFGFSQHSLKIDWEKFRGIAEERLSKEAAEQIDSTLTQSNLTYSDWSLSGGYAYNWVFARNWVFDISTQVAIGYKKTTSLTRNMEKSIPFKDFSFKNFNFDSVNRLAVVWNNMRWYCGMNAIFHLYNYSKSQFSTNTMFGSVNFYFGYNFGKR